MMADEKDRLGEKLRDAERGDEDQYFARRDRELLAKLKRQKEAEHQAPAREGRCPQCGELLRPRTWHDITADECPACGGVWLEKGQFEALAQREREGWVARLWRSRTD